MDERTELQLYRVCVLNSSSNPNTVLVLRCHSRNPFYQDLAKLCNTLAVVFDISQKSSVKYYMVYMIKHMESRGYLY